MEEPGKLIYSDESTNRSNNENAGSENEESEPFQSSGSEYQLSSPSSSDEYDSAELVERTETEKTVVRKRKLAVNGWKRNVQKVKRARGESYQSMSSGKIISKRKQGSNCKCEKECLKKLSPDEKNEIFSAFNELADQEKQDSYLSSLITVSKIKRRRKNVLNPNPQRNCSYKYKVNTRAYF